MKFVKNLYATHMSLLTRDPRTGWCVHFCLGVGNFCWQHGLVPFGVGLGSIIVANPPANKKCKGVFGDFWTESSFQHISAARFCRNQWNVKNVREYTKNILQVPGDWKDLSNWSSCWTNLPANKLGTVEGEVIGVCFCYGIYQLHGISVVRVPETGLRKELILRATPELKLSQFARNILWVIFPNICPSQVSMTTHRWYWDVHGT